MWLPNRSMRSKHGERASLLRFPPHQAQRSLLSDMTRAKPHRQEQSLRERLSAAFPYDLESRLPKYIWQTWKYAPWQEAFTFQAAESSWTKRNPDFKHAVITDGAARSIIGRVYSDIPEVPQAFDALPKPVLKADFFRHLILLARGGIHSDIDTTALKPFANWIPLDMEPYGLAVGIEADPDRLDWHDWYARRIQFCQWTIAAKPSHPVLDDIVASIVEETLDQDGLERLKNGIIDVMDYSAPGIWTDSLFSHFNNTQYVHSGYLALEFPDAPWRRFANLREPMKEKVVVVLPITSFSPGVGLMGAGARSDPMACVLHGFSGTWKHDESR